MLRMICWKIYAIEDCMRFDSAITDNSNNYTYDGISSLTHSTDHYVAVRTSRTNYYSPIYIDETLPSDYEISVDVHSTSINGTQTMLTVAPNHPLTYTGASEGGIVSNGNRYGLFKRLGGTFTAYTTSGSLHSNTWYNFKLKVVGTSVTATITDLSNNTVVHTATQTINEVTNWNKWNIIVGDGAYALNWKNLKIKPL